MKKRYLLIYFAVITIPLFLGLAVWQSNRYRNMEQEIRRLEQLQSEWVEGNKRLIAANAVLSSPQRIEHIAQKELGLRKIRPENVLQVNITEGKGREF
jgi:cell division protein FtsL